MLEYLNTFYNDVNNTVTYKFKTDLDTIYVLGEGITQSFKASGGEVEIILNLEIFKTKYVKLQSNESGNILIQLYTGTTNYCNQLINTDAIFITLKPIIITPTFEGYLHGFPVEKIGEYDRGLNDGLVLGYLI